MQKLGGRLKVPIYAAHGGQDHITSAKVSKRAADGGGLADLVVVG